MIDKVKKRLKSKTYITALVGLALTTVEMNSGLLLGWMDEVYKPYAVLLWPLAMLTLREMTTAALDDK